MVPETPVWRIALISAPLPPIPNPPTSYKSLEQKVYSFKVWFWVSNISEDGCVMCIANLLMANSSELAKSDNLASSTSVVCPIFIFCKDWKAMLQHLCLVYSNWTHALGTHPMLPLLVHHLWQLVNPCENCSNVWQLITANRNIQSGSETYCFDFLTAKAKAKIILHNEKVLIVWLFYNNIAAARVQSINNQTYNTPTGAEKGKLL